MGIFNRRRHFAKDVPSTPVVPEGMVMVKAEDWKGLVEKVTKLEGQPQPNVIVQAPAGPTYQTPTSPTGPSLTDQVSTIDKGILAITQDIDKALKDEKPIGDLLTKRDGLVFQRTSLHTEAAVSRFEQTGLQYLSQLTDNLPQERYPHLKVEAVDKAYKELVAGMSPEQKANPSARDFAYNHAVGANLASIMDGEKAEWEKNLVNEAGDLTVQLPTYKGYVDPKADAPLTVENVLGQDAKDALDFAGRDIDTMARKMGYASGEEYLKLVEKEGTND